MDNTSLNLPYDLSSAATSRIAVASPNSTLINSHSLFKHHSYRTYCRRSFRCSRDPYTIRVICPDTMCT